MNNRSNALALTSAALLLSLTLTDSSVAQERASTTMPNPGTDRSSCADVDWHRDLLRDYPWVGDACHETVMVDGQRWARFEAEFQQLNRDGTIISDFRDSRGRSMGNVSLKPEPGQRVLLDGRRTQFADLRRGQVLNFYAPEGMYALTTEAGAPTSQQVQFVEPRADDEPRASQSSRQLAQAEPASNRRAATLPATAGALPIVALGGMLSLLGGITLGARRRYRSSKL